MARSGRVKSTFEEGAAPAAPTSTPRPVSGRKVRISVGGAKSTHEFKGRKFTNNGEIFDTEDLGWTSSDAAEAAADPYLVIEPIEVADNQDEKGSEARREPAPVEDWMVKRSREYSKEDEENAEAATGRGRARFRGL